MHDGGSSPTARAHVDRADALGHRHDRRADRERLVEPAAHGDRVRDPVRIAGRQRLDEVAAAAVADQRDPPARPLVQRADQILDALHAAVEAVDVEAHPGAVAS